MDGGNNMAIPKLTEESINDALKYIDEHGVPGHNGMVFLPLYLLKNV